MFKDIPFVPFSKGDKLGRVADWTQSNSNYRGNNNQRQNYGASTNGAGMFSYMHNESEDTFHVVDSRPAQKNKFVNNRQKWAAQNNSRFRRDERWAKEQAMQPKGSRQMQYTRTRRDRYNSSRYRDWNKQEQRVRESHIDVAADWEVKGQVGFSDLQKLNLKGAVKAETLKEAGSLFFYDKTFDRVTSKLEKKVVRTQDTNVSKPSASDDPVLQKMAAAGEGDVFCTDQTLAKLMACTRSIYSWDVVATIKDGKIFLDKKDNKADLLSVGETAAEAPQDDKDAGVNSVDALAKEATDVNHNFLQQVTSKSKPAHSLGEPPFDDPNPTAVLTH